MGENIKQEIIEIWEKILIDKDQKFSKIYRRILVPNVDANIRVSVRQKDKIKSIDFVFNNIKIKKINFKNTKGVSLEIEDNSVLSIYLNKESFLNIYLNLIEEIINSIVNENDEKKIIKLIEDKLNSWKKCFENENFSGLSKEEELGLIGELLTINKLFDLKEYELEEIIQSWKGPENNLHDFKFTNKIYETKTSLSNIIKISNIDQLDYQTYKNLFLFKVTLTKNSNMSNININHLILDLRNKLKKTQYKELFNNKINLYGYFDYHLENYKDFYNLFNIQKYIIDENFISIQKKYLKPGIQNINFEIDLSYCKKNIII
jgi:hypothetical protein